MLTQVADGVWVRQSEWVWTNSIVVRLGADRAYIDALRRGEDPVDARLEDADWLSGPHRSNLEQAQGQ